MSMWGQVLANSTSSQSPGLGLSILLRPKSRRSSYRPIPKSSHLDAYGKQNVSNKEEIEYPEKSSENLNKDLDDSFSLGIEKSPIELILSSIASIGVAIPYLEEIKEYLRQFPDLLHALLLACKDTRKKFGKDIKLFLELYSDPEIEHKYLTLYIKPTIYDKQIRKLINSIQVQLEESLMNCQGFLLLTIDFRSHL